jgi:hypothetical protein
MALAVVLNRRRQVPAEDSPAFGAIAERFRRAGELERAVTLCQEGLQKYPKHLSSRVTLGWALLDLGRYDEARVELEKVLKRAPDNLAAIRGLAQLHDRTEHDDVASIQSEPSEWAQAEDGSEQLEGAHVEYTPEETAEAEAFTAEPGPWVGVQDGLLPASAQTAAADVRGSVEPHPVSFASEVSELSEMDALAAELLNAAPGIVAPPAAKVPPPAPPPAVLELDPSWAPDPRFLEEASAEPPAAPALLEFVPSSTRFPVEQGFIPDEGPGPWPPVFEDEAPQGAGPGAWPPVELRPAIRCAPAVVVEATPAASQLRAVEPPPRPGLLSKLGRFGKRVDARRRATVSEVVAW